MMEPSSFSFNNQIEQFITPETLSLQDVPRDKNNCREPMLPEYLESVIIDVPVAIIKGKQNRIRSNISALNEIYELI